MPLDQEARTPSSRVRDYLVAFNLRGKSGPEEAADWLYRQSLKRGGKRVLSQALGHNRPPEWTTLFNADHDRPFPTVTDKELIAAKEEQLRAENQGVTIVTWMDEEFPTRLRHALYPPPVLYVRGRLKPRDLIAVSIVGSRQATPDYLEFTKELAYNLARQGVTIVSGLARGVDRAAHEGALKAGGRTLAVVGHGVDVIYPKGHRALAESISRSGAILSFYPLGTRPLPFRFPARNWVIAALGAGVVVVQAAAKSGALITAEAAAVHGRTVMAVPGHIDRALSHGPHGLIRDGAVLVASAEDVLFSLKSEFEGELKAPLYDTAEQLSIFSDDDVAAFSEEDQLEQIVLRQLAAAPADAAQLAAEARCDVGAVQACLVRLEVRQLVLQIGGGKYRLTRKQR